MKKQKKMALPTNTKKTHIHKRAGRQFLIKVLLVLGFLIGLGIFIYPFVVDTVNDHLDTAILHKYRSEVNDEDHKKQAESFEEKAKKERLRERALSDPFSEESLENAKVKSHTTGFYLKHTIGVIYIPKIEQSLPIFDSTKEDFMVKGATWMANTSFPIGKVDNHTVISAHRGLPTAKLFTDLPKLEFDDIFILELGEQYYAYRVVSKVVVDPNNTEPIQVKAGRDLVSLLTCTPYMVNSHRLVVTGERTPFTPNMLKSVEDVGKFKNFKMYGMIVGIVLLISGVVYYIWYSYHLMCIKRSKYEVRLRIQDFVKDHELPLTSYKFILFDKKGKHVKRRKKEPIVTEVEEETNDLIIKELYGMDFTLKQSEIQEEYPIFPDLHLKVKHKKDEFFSVKPKKKLKHELFVAKVVNQVPHFWLNKDEEKITHQSWKARKEKLKKALGK
ncbi:MAG: class C sortase [Lactobacillales bacterium]|jgi:sortase A|nr:class C sortase [Lactobacillales bacterium]